MTTRPPMTLDHYLDALALARATLHGDDQGAMSIANSCDVAMTFQAMTNLYLQLAFSVGNSVAAIDAYLDQLQRNLPAEMFGDAG